MAHGQADGHTVEFAVSDVMLEDPENEGSRNQGVVGLSKVFSPTGASYLNVHVKPDLTFVQPICLVLDIHVVALAIDMLPVCPWKNAVAVGNERQSYPTLIFKD